MQSNKFQKENVASKCFRRMFNEKITLLCKYECSWALKNLNYFSLSLKKKVFHAIKHNNE